MRAFLIVLCLAFVVCPARAYTATTIGVPTAGTYYHGVYPGGVTGAEDDITLQDVTDYEAAAGREVAWVYFSNNWYTTRKFPLATATFIRSHGSVPFIRLMLRGNAANTQGPFTLQNIIDGRFDRAFKKWGDAAKDFTTPLIVEFGTEVNGRWFPWNGVHNGGPRVGPRRFRQAFRHIVRTIKGRGADNITWVFHVNNDDAPAAAWNRFENYYPGDDVVDWIGLSAYGSQTPIDDYPSPVFRDEVDSAYARISVMAPSKPVFVNEFGITNNAPDGTKAPDWADAALADILGDRWANIRGFSWWNETWQNDNNASHDTDMRVQTVPGLSDVFQARLVGNADVVDRPIL